MKAQLVFDGGNFVNVPESMGQPLTDQLVGTPFEQLGEVASRVCYDSFGLNKEGKRKGRSSAKLHEHILEVRNHSVYEHANFTLTFRKTNDQKFYEDLIYTLINRKGVWVEKNDEDLEVTVNPRVILDWERHTREINQRYVSYSIYQTLMHWGNKLCPQIITYQGDAYFESVELKDNDNLSADQAWISLWLMGSRGWSHEQVRHRNPNETKIDFDAYLNTEDMDKFAISQRSTRYVDESESDYIEGPVIQEFLRDEEVDKEVRETLGHLINESTKADKATYDYAVDELEKYFVEKGLEKTSARKQARGAAREYLANALPTEMIYSANVTNWLWILSQRLSALADPQIRVIYGEVLDELLKSRYNHFFQELKTKESPDGIGKVLC